MAAKDPLRYPGLIDEFAEHTAQPGTDPEIREYAQRMRLITHRLINRAIALPTDPAFSDLVIIHSSNAWRDGTETDGPLTTAAIDSQINNLLEWPSERLSLEAENIINWLWDKAAETEAPQKPAAAEHIITSETVLPDSDPTAYSRDPMAGHKPKSNGPRKTRPAGPKSDSLDDLFGMHLSEIGSFPLLTADQEKTVAYRLRAGNAARASLAENPDLPQKQADDLQKLVADGEAARSEFMLANMRLVVSIAKRFMRAAKNLDMSDLVSSGVIGLAAAVDKFDPDRGFKFSTMATWWIRQSIQRELANLDRTIRLPVHALEMERSIYKRIVRFELIYGREPTDSELVIFSDGKITQEMIEKNRATVSGYAASLDAPVGDETDSSLYDYVSTKPQEVSKDSSFEDRDYIATLLDRAPLSYEEKEFMALKYGAAMNLPGGVEFTIGNFAVFVPSESHAVLKDPLTVAQISDFLGCSRDHIRHIQRRALAKIREYAQTSYMPE